MTQYVICCHDLNSTALLRLVDRMPDSQSGDGGSNPSGEIMVRWQRWPNAPVLKTGSS